MKNFILTILISTLPLILRASESAYIEKAINDETFIINGEVYKAKTYCFNTMDGDNVIFVEGSSFGACTSAKFVVVRTGDVCEVWCE